MACPLKNSFAWKALTKANVPYPYFKWDIYNFNPNEVPLPPKESYKAMYEDLLPKVGANMALRTVWRDFTYKGGDREYYKGRYSKPSTPVAVPTETDTSTTVEDEFSEEDSFQSYSQEEYYENSQEDYFSMEEERYVEDKYVPKDTETKDSTPVKGAYSKTITMLSEIEGMPSIEELNNMSEEQLGEILKQLCK
jgi:hypothetical protein